MSVSFFLVFFSLYFFCIFIYFILNAWVKFWAIKILIDRSEFVRAFFDDICIFNMSLGEHPDHSCAVLERLRKHGTTVGPGKAKVPGEVVQYLGHIVGSGRLEPLFTKVEAVKSSRKPKMNLQLRLFFGLTDYYQKFSKNYASLAQPLSDLTRKDIPDRIPWQSHDQQAFNELKMVLFSQLILHSLDNSRLFKLQTDASDFVLSQGAVFSKILPTASTPSYIFHGSCNQGTQLQQDGESGQ